MILRLVRLQLSICHRRAMISGASPKDRSTNSSIIINLIYYVFTRGKHFYYGIAKDKSFIILIF